MDALIIALGAVAVAHIVTHRPRSEQRLVVPRELTDVLRSLSALLDRVARQPTAPQRSIAVPEDVVRLALHESEPWAAEDLISRARELFVEFDDGRGDPQLVWSRVVAHLKQESGAES